MDSPLIGGRPGGRGCGSSVALIDASLLASRKRAVVLVVSSLPAFSYGHGSFPGRSHA
jgi:hypothetical protein